MFAFFSSPETAVCFPIWFFSQCGQQVTGGCPVTEFTVQVYDWAGFYLKGVIHTCALYYLSCISVFPLPTLSSGDAK